MIFKYNEAYKFIVLILKLLLNLINKRDSQRDKFKLARLKKFLCAKQLVQD